MFEIIHEKLNCNCYQINDDELDIIEKIDVNPLISGSCQTNQETFDIGGLQKFRDA